MSRISEIDRLLGYKSLREDYHINSLSCPPMTVYRMFKIFEDSQRRYSKRNGYFCIEYEQMIIKKPE